MGDVLRTPGMRLLLAGQTTSMVGDWMLLLVLGMWVKTLTGSNSLAGSVMLAVAAPSLASPLFGWIADRFRRRPFLIAVNLCSAIAVLPLLLVEDRRQVWIVFLVAALYGVSVSISSGAFFGLLKLLVPDESLGSANSMFSGIRQLLRLVGPLLGAGVFVAVGGRVVAMIDAASFAIAAAALAGIRMSESARVRAALHWWAEVSAGARHVWTVRSLRQTTAAVAIGLLALGALDVMAFAYIGDGLHRPPAFLGVLVSAQGIGAIAGALAAARLMKRFGDATVVALGLLAFGATIAMLVYPSVVLALIAMPLAGLASTIASIAFATHRQRQAPGPLMGRVVAATDMVVGGTQTLSMALAASLVAFVDYRLVFALMSAVLLACGAWLWTAVARTSRLLPEDQPVL